MLIIFTAFISSLILLVTVRPIAVRFNLVDIPNERKNHSGNVPLIGGICIYLGILVPYFFIIQSSKFSNVLLLTALLILIQGVWDDLKNLKAKTKMSFQVMLTIIMIYITDVKLESFGCLFGILCPLELGILSIPITIIAVVGLTNAINMIDGIDGFATSFVVIAIIGLIGFNLNSNVSSFNYLLLAVLASSVPFMIFNIAPYPKIKVFLGDGGSLFLGFIISWALIYSSENENFNPSFALWCVAIPLFDFFTVIIIRVIKKRPLMIASKDHIHHILQNKGVSKSKILFLTVFTGLLTLIIGKIIEDNFSNLSFPLFIILFLLYAFIRIYNFSNKKMHRFK